MSDTTPDIWDLYHLGEQIARDKECSIAHLKERDHAIGAACETTNPADRLLFWLARVRAEHASEDATEESARAWLSESSAAVLARFLAFVLGFSGMATFLLASGRGLVNVFIFLALFVIVQFLLCLVAAIVLLKSVRGNAPVVLPVNPVRWLFAKTFPDRRYLREARSVIRIVFLRYGQEMGAIFTFAAALAFLLILALSDFTFVWGSTFNFSDTLVQGVTDALALPWSAWLPAATLEPQVIANTRFHPALTHIERGDIASMRGWWPFLFMTLVVYALAPRVVLWVLARYYYRKLSRLSLLGYPGSDLVLTRMHAPLVRTQAPGAGVEDDVAAAGASATAGVAIEGDERLLLLDWSNALGAAGETRFEELSGVRQQNFYSAGAGALAEDRELIASLDAGGVEHMIVAVKSWEPPMAELDDLLSQLSGLRRCYICLVPLPGREVAAQKMADWQAFARRLPFDVVDVRLLTPTQSPPGTV